LLRTLVHSRVLSLLSAAVIWLGVFPAWLVSLVGSLT